MPAYYFDLKFDGEEPTRDEEGDDLPDLIEVQVVAGGMGCPVFFARSTASL